MSSVQVHLTASEQRFEHVRRRVGLLLAPLAILIVALLDLPGLSPEAHRLAAIMAGVVFLWLGEPIPMAVTTLLALIACVLTGVAPADQVLTQLADPLVFLLIGSFIIVRAVFEHRLDQRLAWAVVAMPRVANSPALMMVAFSSVTIFISSWISNAVVTAMMMPVALSVLRFVDDHRLLTGAARSRFGIGLLLSASYAASIGGMATPIGTPPNLIGLAFIREFIGVHVPFWQWVWITAPVVMSLFVVLMLLLWPRTRFEQPVPALTGKHDRWSRDQVLVCAVAALTITLWLLPAASSMRGASVVTLFFESHLPESTVALLGAGLLLVLPSGRGGPLLSVAKAVEIDWSVVMLYAGAFALGTLAMRTGLADAIGKGMLGWLPQENELLLIFMAAFVAMLVSETTSNTASANLVVPVVIAVAQAAQLDPLAPALAATLASSLGFILPVSTPCNAIVYGSGQVPLVAMLRKGIVLDLVGVVIISLMVHVVLNVVR